MEAEEENAPTIEGLALGLPLETDETGVEADDDSSSGPLLYKPIASASNLAMLCAQMPLITQPGYQQIDLRSIGSSSSEVYDQVIF